MRKAAIQKERHAEFLFCHRKHAYHSGPYQIKRKEKSGRRAEAPKVAIPKILEIPLVAFVKFSTRSYKIDPKSNSKILEIHNLRKPDHSYCFIKNLAGLMRNEFRRQLLVTSLARPNTIQLAIHSISRLPTLCRYNPEKSFS